MDTLQLISVLLNAVFGGGLIIQFFTLRSTRKKAGSEAKAKELDNVQQAITVWRELSEDLKKELLDTRKEYETSVNKMQTEVEGLRRAVTRLTNVNKRMVALLDKITPENLESMVEQIKKIHNES